MFRNFNNIEDGINYLCVNGSETGPMEICESYGTVQTVFKFVSPNNNHLYNETGTCALTATGDFHIVGKIDEDISWSETPIYQVTENIEYIDESVTESPNFACSDCGNNDKERFRTVKTETADGTEYDLECSVCESLETEESPAMALHRMATKLEKYRDAWCCLKSKLKHDAELGQGHKVKRALFLMEEFEKELKLD